MEGGAVSLNNAGGSEAPRKRTINLPCDSKYLKIRMTLEPEQSTIPRELFARALNESLLQLYGLAGGAVALEFIKYDPSEATGIIKVDNSVSQQVWAASCLLTEYGEKKCRLEVIDSSSVLVGLAFDSREVTAKLGLFEPDT
mmetsp:Transcript_29733/g.64928  ORF Transcript_29733/g.64928 Transcript_29733/m.64928 type:complete len:142 (-) Transcript_29733:210-635(-)|eukprot:CAMPEP_0118950386 /NCGR_PEP_ID=MMETSP1169-20130426/51284_1 /TAXON_ID=36882 /ORGANISM="Pyramimonas obovata, Strain CCMP722" /LENGTH=141 /DNA_ID=CAMNT_0006897211 /DNA_START=115 /DNA_END=540 /DNA_ORIENTATION=-